MCLSIYLYTYKHREIYIDVIHIYIYIYMYIHMHIGPPPQIGSRHVEVVQLITGGRYPATARPGGEAHQLEHRSFWVRVFGSGFGLGLMG